MVIFVAYLLGKALWVQMDIAGEFRHGAVSTSDLCFLYRSHLFDAPFLGPC